MKNNEAMIIIVVQYGSKMEEVGAYSKSKLPLKVRK